MNFVFHDIHVEKLFKNDWFGSHIKDEWEGGEQAVLRSKKNNEYLDVLSFGIDLIYVFHI